MEIDRCFEILEIQPGATPDEVRQAYRDIVAVWHPDRFSHNSRLRTKAERKIKECNIAYETLRSYYSPGGHGGTGPSGGAGSGEAGKRDRVEVIAETGTFIALSMWSYLSRSIRAIVKR